jgi:ABC-type transporter Mla MlaB component
VEGTLRLARNTLIWQRGSVMLRLEGELTRAEALRIARSVR